jgi:hypothetical protein
MSINLMRLQRKDHKKIIAGRHPILNENNELITVNGDYHWRALINLKVLIMCNF